MTDPRETLFTDGVEQTVAVVAYLLQRCGGGRLFFDYEGSDNDPPPGTPLAIVAVATWPDGTVNSGRAEPTDDYELGVGLAIRDLLAHLGRPGVPPIDLTVLDLR